MTSPAVPTTKLAISATRAIATTSIAAGEHLLLAFTEANDSVAAHRILRETGALPAVKLYLDEMFGRSEPQ